MWTDLPNVLKNDAKRTEIENLAEDMMFKTQPDGKLMKMIESLHHNVRNVVIPLKYTIGIGSGMKLLVSNTVMGSGQLFSRSKGMHDLLNSDLLKHFQDKEGILKSEMRLDTNVEFGEGWFDTL